MFFPHLLHIKLADLVLEIGPGAYPFWRSDCLADKFDPDDDQVDLKQYGGSKMELSGKPLFKIIDNKLPFKDKSFDYIICSHVLEHVPYQELPVLIAEMNRVSKRKYIEFPTAPYDYFYNFNVHENFLDIVDGKIICLPKEFSRMELVKPYTDFMFNLRIIQRLGIEKNALWLFGAGQEYETDIELIVVKSPDDFFSIVSRKYSIKIPVNKPDMHFLIINKLKKMFRKFRKEKEKTFFENKLI